MPSPSLNAMHEEITPIDIVQQREAAARRWLGKLSEQQARALACQCKLAGWKTTPLDGVLLALSQVTPLELYATQGTGMENPARSEALSA
jgi:hypothetical protein